MRHLLHARLRRVLIGALLTVPVIACWAAESAPVPQPSSTRTEAAVAGEALAPELPFGTGYERRRRAARAAPSPWPPSEDHRQASTDDTTETAAGGNARGNAGNGNGGNGNGGNGNGGRGGRGGRR